VRRVVTLAIMAAALGSMATAQLASAKGGEGLFGLNYTFTELHGKDVGKLAKSGARTVRWTFRWPPIERSQGNFDWSEPDRVVGALTSRGIQVVPTLMESPRWVADSAITPPVNSRHARNAWKDFLRAAVKRYGPGGTYWTAKYRLDHPAKAVRPIRTWQIWNEPNLKSHYAPHPSPGSYAKLLKISHSAIHQQDRGAKVMFAGMPGYSNDIDAWSFLKRVYRKHGIRHAFDVVALHPYARDVNQMLGEVKRVRKVMAKHGDGRTPLWMTEVGWGSSRPTRFGLTKGKHGQARVLKHAFRALKHKRHRWHIDRVLWFNYRDPKGGTKGCSFCNSAGLLKNNLRPKPSWRAFRSFTH
jgi:hypothetical protein